MCGIVGKTGNDDAVKVVMEGLTRLEYRGYDSAGISVLDHRTHTMVLLKKEGKLDHLKALIEKQHPKGTTAIGHTRWATHGMVTDINAHPHNNEDFSIVHNGIIENAHHLKTLLLEQGYQFHTQTDTEVFLVLLTKEYKSSSTLEEAFLKTFKQLEGSSAFVMMHRESKNLYAIKRGAPLVCGSKQGELYLSSDPYALIGHVEDLYFPEDDVLCVLNQSLKKIQFFELDGSSSKRYRQEKQQQGLEVSSKGNFAHYMLKEIFEQPALVTRLWQYYTSDEQAQESLMQLRGKKFERIYIVGCGTAWHAGLILKELWEQELQIPVSCELASEFRYRKPLVGEGTLCLFISQSGETADTLACALMVKALGAKVFSIVNVKGSSLYRESDLNFLIHAGQEIGVASTKAFTMQVLTGHLMLLGLTSKNKEHLDESLRVIRNDFYQLESKMQELLTQHGKIKNIAKGLAHHKGFIFIGRGIYFPIALEGALKLKEIAYVHAEGYAAGELKHGPIALIDRDMVVVSLLGPELFEKSLSNTEEVRAREAIVFAITSIQHQPQMAHFAKELLTLEMPSHWIFNDLYVNLVLQLFSYEVAITKGTDIDRPRNLAKSVTVE